MKRFLWILLFLPEVLFAQTSQVRATVIPYPTLTWNLGRPNNYYDSTLTRYLKLYGMTNTLSVLAGSASSPLSLSSTTGNLTLDTSTANTGIATLWQNSLKANKSTTLTLSGTSPISISGGSQSLGQNDSWTASMLSPLGSSWDTLRLAYNANVLKNGDSTTLKNSINVGGTLSNIPYKDQSNVFIKTWNGILPDSDYTAMYVNPIFNSSSNLRTGAVYGFQSTPHLFGADSVDRVYGIYTAIWDSLAVHVTNFYGYVSEPSIMGTGGVDIMYGGYFKPMIRAGASGSSISTYGIGAVPQNFSSTANLGFVSSVYAGYTGQNTSFTNGVSLLYGAAPDLTGGATLGYVYGLRIDDLTGKAGTVYAIQTGGGRVVLGSSTADVWGTDQQTIYVGRDATISAPRAGGTSNYVLFSQNAFNDGAWKYIESSQASNYYQLGGTHVFRVAASGTAGNPITWNNVLSLNNDLSATFYDKVAMTDADMSARPYAELYVTDTTGTTTLTLQSAYYTLHGWNQSGLYGGGCTVTDSSITVGKTGVYKISASTTLTVNNNHEEVHMVFFNGANEISKSEIETEMPTSGDHYAFPLRCLASLTAGDVIKIKVKDITSAGKIVTLVNGNWGIEKIN